MSNYEKLLARIKCKYRFKYRLNYRNYRERWSRLNHFVARNFYVNYTALLNLPLLLILFPGISDIGAEDRRDLLYHCLRVTERFFLARCKWINSNLNIRLTLR